MAKGRPRRSLACVGLVGLVGLASCAQPSAIAPRIVHGLDDTPFLGADSLVISVEQGGLPIEGVSVRVPPGATTFELDGVPFGVGLALRVESRLGEVVLARGRSFPFDYPSADQPPGPPDVFVGTLGRFARALETDRTIVALAPTPYGALVATSDGEILGYEAHGASDGSAQLAPRATLPGRSGASWIAVGSGAAVRLLGVGGASGGASLVDPDGQVVAELPASGLAARSGIALALASDASWVLAIGGRDGGGAAVRDVVRVDVGATTLSASPLAPLDTPRAGASAVRVGASDGTSVVDVVLVLGGGAPANVALLDVTGAPVQEFAVDPPIDARALVAVETGLVVAAGGSDTLGAPTDSVDLFLVQIAPHPVVARFSPSPPPLYAARAHAVALALGPGLALLVGGTDATGAPVAGAELVEVALDTLPGRVVPTGALPAGAAAGAVVRLADRSVLVGGAGVLSIYIPPRGPS